MEYIIQILQFILALTILVTLHEGGHFMFSKLFGVRVSRFYIFANWKFHIWSSYDNWFRKLIGKAPVTERVDGDVHFFQQLCNIYYKFTGQKDKIVTTNVGNKKYDDKVGTEYGIGWLPIGGYCQIDGMIDETQTADELSQTVQPWEFRSKNVWQRLLIMIGGVLVNFVTALFIYSMIMYTWGDSYIAPQSMTDGMQFNDEAKKHGFKDGDIIIGTDEGEFERFDVDVYRAVAKAENVIVIRDGKQVTVHKPETSLLTMLKETPRYMDPVTPNVVDSVFADGPAAKAGMLAGDKIVAVDSTATKTFNDVNFALAVRSDILETAKSSKDSLAARNITLVVQRAAAKDSASDVAHDTLHLTLTEDLKLGVAYKPYQALYEPTEVEYGFFESFPAGINYGLNVLNGYVSDMQYLASADGAKSVGGFGTLGGMFPKVWDWYKFWMLSAFLSIVLAFMNILPIPILDGGHVLFLIYEMITGRALSLKVQEIANNIGLTLLMGLMIWANLADILRALGIM